MLEDCHWFVKGKGDEARMAALCMFCASKLKKGWYWPGKEKGYGDYDLICDNCQNAIYLREAHDNDQKEETAATVQDSRG